MYEKRSQLVIKSLAGGNNKERVRGLEW